jgi:hypothetical protein
VLFLPSVRLALGHRWAFSQSEKGLKVFLPLSVLGVVTLSPGTHGGEAFTAVDIPGHADGDYPEWLRQSQLDWFPKDLIEK